MKDQEETENMEEPRIDKTIYTGRPENTKGRLEKEIAVYDFLDSLGIEYKRVDHEALMTMEACEEVDHLLEAKICKNLFLCNRQKTDFYLLLMPGEKPFKTKFLSKQIGTARLSFADGEQMEEYLNITPGSLSLMGLIFDREKRMHLVIDREVLDEEYFGCHPCINTSTLLMKTSDVKEKILPALNHEYQVVELPTE
ncbi:prolyl-tRNA synthetase associated domain-containing protein [Ruminococcus sp. OM08-9BH]|nr:prolyl-tRNA synthetase associated domain-containing protein [Ruminococcus sp. OM08-9BH]